MAESGLREAPADPILRDPQLDDRLKAAAQADRVAREVRELEDRIGSRVGSLARRFDRVVRILEIWGYLDDWALTESGERLASLFHESDLLWPRRSGKGSSTTSTPPPWPVWSRSSPTSTAARTRRRRRGSRRRRSATDPAIAALATELNAIEDEAGLDLTRAPDPTFLAVAHAWAAGEALDDVLEDEDLSGGDFVRNVKQVIDLLGQVADVTDQPTSAAAVEASGAAGTAVWSPRLGCRDV